MFKNVTKNICTSSEFIDQGSADISREEVKVALKQHFEETRNFLAACLDFFRTVQQEGQSITDFLAELRNKAKLRV